MSGLGLGLTLWNDGDFSPSMKTVSGREALVQALLRRLSTSAGGLWYDQDYGRNLCDFVNQSVTSAWVVEQAVEMECSKDERVTTCDATAELNGQTITLTIAITTDDDDSFELVVEVSSVTVEILEVNEAN